MDLVRIANEGSSTSLANNSVFVDPNSLKFKRHVVWSHRPCQNFGPIGESESRFQNEAKGTFSGCCYCVKMR